MFKFSFLDRVLNFQMLMYLWTHFFVTDVNSVPGEWCSHRFNHKVHKCMGPFLDLYESHRATTQRGLPAEGILIKHLCFEYEKMLQCIHSSLSTCPTLKNVQRVQHKLGADWVMGVNQLCRIQSKNGDDNREEEERGYLPNGTSQDSDSSLGSDRGGFTASEGNDIPVSGNLVQDSIRNYARVKRVQNVANEASSERGNIDYRINNIAADYGSSSADTLRLSSISLSWMVFLSGSMLLTIPH